MTKAFHTANGFRDAALASSLTPSLTTPHGSLWRPHTNSWCRCHGYRRTERGEPLQHGGPCSLHSNMRHQELRRASNRSEWHLRESGESDCSRRSEKARVACLENGFSSSGSAALPAQFLHRACSRLQPALPPAPAAQRASQTLQPYYDQGMLPAAYDILRLRRHTHTHFFHFKHYFR